MKEAMNARQEILSRIREALGDIPASEQPEAVARSYRHSGTATHEEVLARFVERVVDYKVDVQRVKAEDLPQTIAAICVQRGVQRLVVPVDVPSTWLPGGIELLRDDPPLTNEQLDGSDGVLTGCALGIAQTGTIVLDGGAAQGRRVLSLLPDYHLCIIREAQIVELVPEAIARLGDTIRLHHSPLTFISGPSATSDIELNRVEGVHGPRTLDVLISQ